MRQLKSVIRFEFNTFAKNKAFVAMVLLLMVIALVGPAVPAIINRFDIGGGGTSRTIAVVDNTGVFDQASLDEMLAPNVVMMTDINAANQAVLDGTHNYAVELNRDSYVLSVMTVGMGVFNLESQIANLLSHQFRMEALQSQGVDPNLSAEILTFHPVGELVALGAGEGDADTFFQNFILAYVMAFVLMLGLQIGGGHLLTAVVREKSTKTMELLVTSCKSTIMLMGKVIGTGAALMIQIIVLAASAAVGMLMIAPLVAGDAEGVFALNFSPMILMYLIVFFLLGFIVYAFMYAALASTCSRMEDAQSLSQIPILIMMAGFMMVMVGMNNPGAAWIVPVSFIPFLSPFVMFMRICMGTADTWEILVSIAIQVASIGIVAWAAAKIYRMGTLMYGAKPTMKGLLEAFK